MASHFPNFPDWDVKVVLSDRQEDVLRLNTSVLARESPFFKASLERLEWSHNKVVRLEGDKTVEHEYKLLVLDYAFDKGDTFPFLAGRNQETSIESLESKRSTNDGSRRSNKKETVLTGSNCSSGTVITAYKIGFALIYGLRIDLPATEVHKAAFFIPALMDFLDVYGLLPAYNDKVINVIFGGSCDGYELVAGDPMRFLKVACTLQSKVIYQEAMIHAVGIVDKIGGPEICDPEWFAKIGEHQLHLQFTSHAKEFHDKITRIERHLLHVHPDCCNKLGIALDIGLAIFRAWILERDHDIANEICTWGPQKDKQIINVKFGHIHRVIENTFVKARAHIVGEFEDGRLPTASPRQKVGRIRMNPSDNPYHYYANVKFSTNYKYPWEIEDKAELPAYAPFEAEAAREEDGYLTFIS